MLQVYAGSIEDLSFIEMVAILQDFAGVTDMSNFLKRICMVSWDAVSKLESFVWIWNHFSRSLTWLLFNNSELCRMTYLNMIFYVVVSTYRYNKIDKICNSTQSPYQLESGL